MKKRFTSQRKAIKQKEYGKALSSLCSDCLALILSCYILYAYGKQSEKKVALLTQEKHPTLHTFWDITKKMV